MYINKKIYGNDIDYESMSKLDYFILSKGIKGFVEIYKEVCSMKFNVVVIPPLDSINEYIKGLFIFCLCKYKRKKTVYFWEKWEAPKNKQPLKQRFKNCLMRNTAKVIFKRVDMCLSPGRKNREYFIKAGVKNENIREIHNSSEVPRCDSFNIKKKFLIPQNCKIILYYGRIIRQKGLDILIRAYSQLPKEIKLNTYLLVIGDGDFKLECEVLANKLCIENIKFIGYVNPQYRYIYFSQCDVFVLPGWFYKGKTDVWGLTINEALQCGKVIISTNAVGSAYELINNNNGLMIEENNVNSLKSALISLYDNPLDHKAVKEAAKLLKKYNYETMASDFYRAIIKVIFED
jgi:glycosyltransferase involved in cell wall biosynthesis